jgi:hypothetical protein
MGLFNATPEERAVKEQRRADKQRQRAAEEFAKTPAGQAHAAREAGLKIFQISVPLSETTGYTLAMQGAYARSSEARDYAGVIQSIEEQGWHLEHVGYVFRHTGSVSRDKFFSSGQQEAVTGQVIGIYLFRAVDA